MALEHKRGPRHLPIPDIRLPSDIGESPFRQLGWRLVIGMSLILIVSVMAYVGRDGYTDSSDGSVDLLDAVYYATVSITTTGYGDVIPVSDRERLITTVVVTPMRMMFLVLLVGTSVELIAAATRRRLRRQSWRNAVKDHTIICGFGVKGRAALQSLVEQGTQPSNIVIIDSSTAVVESAARLGHVGVLGDMTSNAVLQEAALDRATTVIVSTPSSDDTAVLTVLTVRDMAPDVRIVASARETENAPLLRNGGADVVLTSAGATGRMLGLASSSPCAVRFIEDLLERGSGFDLHERGVEAGGEMSISEFSRSGELVVAVFRDGNALAVPNGGMALLSGDRIVSLQRTSDPVT